MLQFLHQQFHCACRDDLFYAEHPIEGEDLQPDTCLFLSGYGFLHGITIAASLAFLGKTKLEMAARAGRLYTVVRLTD
jgi:hypothetical protein